VSPFLRREVLGGLARELLVEVLRAADARLELQEQRRGPVHDGAHVRVPF
jgi:hypothetical protein